MAKTPKPCMVCERLTKKASAPTKCKRHGGKAHPKTRSTKPRGGKRSRRPAPAVRNGTGQIAARVKGLVQLVEAAKRAQAVLDEIRAAMAV